ncbi:integrase [Mesorhizobium sp. B2-4-13]|uniref:phage integrase N-terminal domain-containing protein n=1 Tax=Mesorhizobium sp. B2-4-13 TaxID=2589936 RepID=UPI001150025D|nr:phage integrase N-terminal domain-containing protein [Mesorhizobium sp. B2-4-13]TPK79032.1 integrase [Mesorhizobium sp. B2-4-13]
MKELHFDLMNLTRHSGEGSFSTKACRARGLQQLADELHALGFKLKAAKNLAPKHVDRLVASWKAGGIVDATIRNRLGWLRWWAEKAGKAGMIPADNAHYGLEERTRGGADRAQALDAGTLAKIGDRKVELALKLQAAFGLRREEALKMRPVLADRGARLILQASWTKGGRYREIPLTHPKQRALLDEVRAECGDGSLIGDGRNYIQAVKNYENKTLRAGCRNPHKHRHAYAQWRYKVLTGWACPKKGGPTVDQMSRADAARDRAARLEISHELGHGRLDVTDTYLGRRYAAGVKRAA